MLVAHNYVSACPTFLLVKADYWIFIGQLVTLWKLEIGLLVIFVLKMRTVSELEDSLRLDLNLKSYVCHLSSDLSHDGYYFDLCLRRQFYILSLLLLTVSDHLNQFFLIDFGYIITLQVHVIKLLVKLL